MLLTLTFPNRREEIRKGVPDHLESYCRAKCPVLIHPQYVNYLQLDLNIFKILINGLFLQLCYDFDHIFPGENKCRQFRQNWMTLVPHILSAASKLKKKTISEFLKQPRFQGREKDFGN